MTSPHASTRHGRLSASGASASSENDWQGWKSDPAAGARRSFPPSLVVAVKALACELPYESEVPLSRWSVPEIRREVIERGLVASIGETTLWRWLSEDAIRPWSHRSWCFPRDPDFERKASRVLDLYEGRWQSTALSARDCVVCADEKTSIQARHRCHATLPPARARPMRVEHEYDRLGAWAYLAAWDVRRARVFGRCERSSSIAAFDRLVAQVMGQRPYRCAPRVFWIIDNGTTHRGARCVARLQRRWPNLIPVHTPVHASWLNQVELYFSVLQRKALVPNDFRSLSELEQRLSSFQKHYQQVARPFQWRFTRRDLRRLMAKLNATRLPLAKAA